MKAPSVARSVSRLLLPGLLAGAVLALGCGTKVKTRDKEDPGEAEMQKFLALHNEYTVMNGKGPANAEQLKSWAKRLKPEKLKEMGVEDVEKFFVSPRDNQPYVVLPNTQNNSMAIVVHEKTGKDGKRWAGNATGRVLEVTPEELKEQGGR